MNDTHIYNCFNETISQFVLCKRASTDVLWTMSIPLNSTPSTRVTATDRLQTRNPRGLSHADCQVGAWDFFSGQTVRRLGKLVPCKVSRQHALPAGKGVFCMSKLIDIFEIQSRVKYVELPNPLLSSAQRTHHSVLDTLSAGLVVPLDVVHEVVRAFELPLSQ